MNMKMWLPVMAIMGMSMQSSRAEVMPDSLNSGINVRNLDKNVRPGADFYEFACGGWMANNPLKAEYSRYGTFEELIENNAMQIRGLI